MYLLCVLLKFVPSFREQNMPGLEPNGDDKL